MGKKPTTSVNNLFPLLSILENKGVDIQTFLSEFGVVPDIRLYPDRRILTDTLIAITHKAADLTGDNDIGLHQGEVFSGFSNILGHVLLNCGNAGEVFDKFNRYQRIIDEGKTLEVSIRDDRVLLEFKSEYPAYIKDSHFMIHFMTGVLTYFNILTGKRLNIDEAFFIHKTPGNTAEYERIFRCKLNFNSSMNAFIFDKSNLLVPVLQPNKELLVVLEKYAQEVLQRLSENDSYSNRTRKLIIDMIRAESPSIETVASTLRMSERNLQLKLKEEGTTFSRLLRWVREELASEYLKDREIPVEEIAYLLGYSDPSVFNHSFKKWTGVTPGMYRKTLNRP